ALSSRAVEHDPEQTLAAIRDDRWSDERIDLRIRARRRRQVSPRERILIQVRSIERAAFGQIGKRVVVGHDREVESSRAQNARGRCTLSVVFDLERDRLEAVEGVELDEQVEALA